MMRHHLVFLPLIISLFIGSAFGFTAPRHLVPTSATNAVVGQCSTALHAQVGDDATDVDPSEIIARRIIVTGSVDGGYYRTCVKNEASRFRRVFGTMSPPDDNKR
eukprot:CAMPEP_0172314560 /NCGR_PEP_ID=MMETSP1058-20130122/22835_1 /TAXON_ID=83371 /ORGANISM="Detonula confervacea, Strain CCMP 353" /LENGTH=104 /DNA_ID=CAMNT_0013028455 /DNA_START=82 /DNA_END=393 /DNA_ORIENTATION=+